jgi:predicted Fe-Mo cluster-binding NifX family protein
VDSGKFWKTVCIDKAIYAEAICNIAVTSEGEYIDSDLSIKFEECKYLLIVDLEDLSIQTINCEGVKSGEKLALNIIELDCEAIITGILNSISFDILANACVTRYCGAGYSVIRR